MCPELYSTKTSNIKKEKKGGGGRINCVWSKTVDSKTADAKKIRGRGGLQNYMSKTTGEKKVMRAN